MTVKHGGWLARWLARIWVPILLAAAVQAQTSRPVLHVVGDHSPPFRIVNGDQCTGMYCDVMNVMAERAGYAIRFSAVPPKRALMMMREGQADVMLGPNRTAEREQFMRFLEARFPAANKAFYTRPDGPAIRSYTDLNGLLIAYEAGKVFFDPFDTDQQLRREPSNDSLTALRKVAARRSDCALLPETEGDWLIRREGLMLVKAAWIVPGRTSHIAFSHASPIQAAIAPLEAAFVAMERDGSLKAILARYQ